ncbi:MAG: desaturase [Phycisphaeraceae bacterium]|nr:desaturase [Phycisphaeraceae bacterium]
MIVVELRAPGRPWPKVAGWWTRAILLNSVQVAIVFVSGVAWDPWMRSARPWSAADALGTTGGAVAGYLAITFIYYWWHRWRHEVPLLWRWLHQVHHSPQRIEVITSFYKHPFEIIVNSLLSSAILYLLVGLDPRTASFAVMVTGLAELFYHWNVSTPHWVGYLFQRPESHCVHHQSGLHKYNYADLPLWDMLFGTFRNPRQWTDSCGFADEERRLGAMLAGVDVNAPGKGATS